MNDFTQLKGKIDFFLIAQNVTSGKYQQNLFDSIIKSMQKSWF